MHTRHDHIDAGGVGMHAVGLIEFRVGRHPVEEERIKDDRMSRGKRRIDGVESFHVIGAHVARRLHTGEQDSNMTRDRVCPVFCPAPPWSPPDRCRAARHWRRAPGSRHQCPAAPTSRAGRGPPEAVSPETPALAILTACALGFERRLKPLGKRGVGGQPVTGAERIAEHHDSHRPLVGKADAPAQKASQRNSGRSHKALDHGHFRPI